jgi:hypothetical protein
MIAAGIEPVVAHVGNWDAPAPTRMRDSVFDQD